MLASPQELPFEVFGVHLSLRVTDPEMMDGVQRMLPPGSQPSASDQFHATFELDGDPKSGYTLSRNGEALASGLDSDAALKILDRELRALIALEAPDHIFVHAGAVAHAGSALLVPGATHSGKTSLVAALVRAGAQYYSDEFAPLDAEGLVHPFPKPLSIRDEKWRQVDHDVNSLGGTAGDAPAPVGLVVIGHYEAGAEWRPRRLSAGEAVLELLAHTIPAQSRPTAALSAISRCLEQGTPVLEGPRGEAEEVAPRLLDELERTR